MYVAGYVLFAARDLRVLPAAIGLIDAVRGPGFLVGAAIVASVTRASDSDGRSCSGCT
jgi:hypothetical protein